MKMANKYLTAIDNTQQQNFKAVNNLLTLQENHVEEFFQYHGEEFVTSIALMIEDIVQKVVSEMLSKLEFSIDTAANHITLQQECLSNYRTITEENIQLDIQKILNNAVNNEVVLQRKMAKQQYLESQGFAPQTTGAQAQNQPMMGAMGAGAIGGVGGATVGLNQGMQTGYPVPPSGYDQMNNPYWIDPQTGQITYSPPSGGLGLMSKATKVAAWAKWLA
tara:strand:+ start:1005 stop:1664 length:660 start_codon:yes stop_codon:yes gene_type:complete